MEGYNIKMHPGIVLGVWIGFMWLKIGSSGELL
jgi:hypothetical protein